MQSAGFLFLFFLLSFFSSPILVISFPPCLDISDIHYLYLIFSCEMQQLSFFHTYIQDLNIPPPDESLFYSLLCQSYFHPFQLRISSD